MIKKLTHKALLITLVMGSVSMLVVGCGSKDTESYISQYNKNIEKIKMDYDYNVEEAKNIENLILDTVLYNNYSDGINKYLGSNVPIEDLKSILNDSNTLIYDKCRSVLIDLNYYKGGSEDYEPTEEEIIELINQLKAKSNTYYLLDKESGGMEQFFVIRVYDKIIKVSLNWLGGVIYDYNSEIR